MSENNSALSKKWALTDTIRRVIADSFNGRCLTTREDYRWLAGRLYSMAVHVENKPMAMLARTAMNYKGRLNVVDWNVILYLLREYREEISMYTYVSKSELAVLEAMVAPLLPLGLSYVP